LGIGGVGKTALSIQFVKGVFVDQYNPTIEECFRKIVEVDGKFYNLSIVDTAGCQQFSGIRDLYMKDGHGFLFVYAINSVTSFQALNEFFERLFTVKDTKVGIPTLMVGNKSDLVNEREITPEQVREAASKFKSEFLDTSAKTKLNVQEAFINVIKQIVLMTPNEDSGGKRRRNCIIS